MPACCLALDAQGCGQPASLPWQLLQQVTTHLAHALLLLGRYLAGSLLQVSWWASRVALRHRSCCCSCPQPAPGPCHCWGPGGCCCQPLGPPWLVLLVVGVGVPLLQCLGPLHVCLLWG